MKNFIGQNQIMLCKVTKIRKTYFEVSTSFGQKGVVYINEISDYFVKNIEDFVQLNSVLYLTIKGRDEFGRIVFSFKENRSEFLKTPFEFSIKKTNQNFKNLYNFTNKEIEKWKK